MMHFKTIADYCEGIDIPPPKHAHLDIRKFEDNMKTVRKQMQVFRHEFYAIAIKADGDGKAVSGQFSDFPEGTSLFFNTPFQLLSWDILPNWTGYYVMISQDFISQSGILNQILAKFPFLKIDKSIPFSVPEGQVGGILDIYDNIWNEYHGDTSDKFQMIEAHVYVLLLQIKRLFESQVDAELVNSSLKAADLKLLSRYQTLIQTTFYPDRDLANSHKLHSTQYYAEMLSVHPNHLNAVVKNLTGVTALRHIHNHLCALSKSYLVHTDWSVKEIAYTLHFDSPNNFSAFFKKNTGTSPLAYRQQSIL